MKKDRILEDRFHKEVLQSFQNLHQHRTQIMKNYEALNNQNVIKNYQFVKNLERLINSHCPCLHGDSDHVSRSAKKKNENEDKSLGSIEAYTKSFRTKNRVNESGEGKALLDGSSVVQDTSNKKFKRTLFGNKQIVRVDLNFRGDTSFILFIFYNISLFRSD